MAEIAAVQKAQNPAPSSPKTKAAIKQIFISYRRSDGLELARNIRYALKEAQLGACFFFDLESIGPGEYDQGLMAPSSSITLTPSIRSTSTLSDSDYRLSCTITSYPNARFALSSPTSLADTLTLTLTDQALKGDYFYVIPYLILRKDSSVFIEGTHLMVWVDYPISNS
jgi:hypothetical protein